LDVARGSMFEDGERGMEEEKEVRRGVGVSPVKGGGKGRGFVRYVFISPFHLYSI
jgi:hypothetical protein